MLGIEWRKWKNLCFKKKNARCLPVPRWPHTIFYCTVQDKVRVHCTTQCATPRDRQTASMGLCIGIPLRPYPVNETGHRAAQVSNDSHAGSPVHRFQIHPHIILGVSWEARTQGLWKVCFLVILNNKAQELRIYVITRYCCYCFTKLTVSTY